MKKLHSPFPIAKLATKKHSGFTLIEVMVVIVILGILAAVVVPNIMDKPDAARITKAKQDLRALSSALDLYRLDQHKYPTTDQGLEALASLPAGSPSWKEGGYIKSVPKDPWGNAYQYLSPGTHGPMDIYTLGADNTLGGEGTNADIGNWSIE